MKQRNIVQFFRAFSFQECTYLVLELCPNGSLMDMVKRRKGLTEAEVRFYSVQVAGAIKYMHGKGIIHRDLKMGNIFLDRYMNAKVGDFGLAALVVTGKDMQTIRRTTLCGTPNYIAPEILEKGRQGHDHMVDIWSLGIIMFAMLTSKPPFQSTSTEEIYRRAKERDYDWPIPEETNKYISAEAKDLVAMMLEDADRRPDPDDIVQHPFFACGYMPVQSDMSTKLLTLPPEEPSFWANRMTPELQTTTLKNLRAMCKDCGVGPWSNHQVIHVQTWKEMAAEEKAGMTPAIPLADDIVYRPFDEWLKEPQSSQVNPHASLAVRSRPEGHLPTSQTAPTGLLRAPPQSFAAQQRAQGRPAGLSSSVRARPTSDAVLSTSQAVPTRPKTVRQYTATEPLAETVEEPLLKKSGSTRRAPLPKSQSTSALPTTKDVLPVSGSSGTLRSSSSKATNGATLFSPSESPQAIVDSQPDAILERLRRLQAELERALNARTMAIISAKDKAPAHPQVVVKWVDYTNKFGLGYILNDGGVGCILRDIPTTESGKTATLPSACMLVRNAERHIERRQDENYAERHQPIPPHEDINFYENNGEDGLNWVGVPASKFRVQVSEDGIPGKLNPGKDVFEHRKRERVILWKKFANYMIAYGRDEPVPSDDNATQQPSLPDAATQPSDLVTFYQRFGDVGCWVFCDGHLQVCCCLRIWSCQANMISSSTSLTTPRSSSTLPELGVISGICPRMRQRLSLLPELSAPTPLTTAPCSHTPCRLCSTSSPSRSLCVPGGPPLHLAAAPKFQLSCRAYLPPTISVARSSSSKTSSRSGTPTAASVTAPWTETAACAGPATARPSTSAFPARWSGSPSEPVGATSDCPPMSTRASPRRWARKLTSRRRRIGAPAHEVHETQRGGVIRYEHHGLAFWVLALGGGFAIFLTAFALPVAYRTNS